MMLVARRSSLLTAVVLFCILYFISNNNFSENFGDAIVSTASGHGESSPASRRLTQVPQTQRHVGAITAEFSFIGLSSESINNKQSGVVIVNHKNGPNADDWTPIDAFAPQLAKAGDAFGSSIGMSGNLVVIGAYGDSDVASQAGAAYVYQYSTTWDYKWKIIPPESYAGGRFGISCSVYVAMTVIGADGVPTDGVDSGAAYVFWKELNRNSWAHVSTLVAPDAASGDRFGYAVAVYGSVAVVGAFGKNVDSGAVYVFQQSVVNDTTVWSFTEKIAPADLSPGARFGISLSLSRNMLVVGASGAVATTAAGSVTSGAVYIYSISAGSTASMTAKVVPSNGRAGDSFGISVALSQSPAGNNLLLVGADGRADGAGSGAVYAYEQDGGGGVWKPINLYVAQSQGEERFGQSVSLGPRSIGLIVSSTTVYYPELSFLPTPAPTSAPTHAPTPTPTRTPTPSPTMPAPTPAPSAVVIEPSSPGPAATTPAARQHGLEDVQNQNGSTLAVGLFVLFVLLGAVLCCSVSLIVVLRCYRRQRAHSANEEVVVETVILDADGIAMAQVINPVPDPADPALQGSDGYGALNGQLLTYDMLLGATDSFSQRNLIGTGGFGAVYKGKLQHRQVAIKRLNEDGCQGEREFRNEVQTLSRACHVNLVQLIGHCREGTHRVLVYEFMKNGSLAQAVHNPGKYGFAPLTWRDRERITLGIARGLQYLHESLRPCIVHCDFKTANVLLDPDFTPKLADFGLAQTMTSSAKKKVATTMGTAGYIDPAHPADQPADTAMDVYGFGITVLELLSARKPWDRERALDMVAAARAVKDAPDDAAAAKRLLDAALPEPWPAANLAKFLDIVLPCVGPREDRPAIGSVIEMLEELRDGVGDLESDEAAGPREAFTCLICMDARRDAKVRPCGHVATCMQCAYLLQRRKDPCPICRQLISGIVSGEFAETFVGPQPASPSSSSSRSTKKHSSSSSRASSTSPSASSRSTPRRSRMSASEARAATASASASASGGSSGGGSSGRGERGSRRTAGVRLSGRGENGTIASV